MRTPLLRSVLAAAAAVFAVAVVGGCSEKPATPTGSEPFVYFTGYGEGGDSASLDGTLEDRDGCLVVVSGGATVVPAFAFGQATWDGERLTVASFDGSDVEPDGQVVAVGDEIHLTGGLRDTLNPDHVSPSSCPDDAQHFDVYAYP
jgi:hypothetical protein